MANLPRIEVPIVDYGSEEQAMVRYRAEGERRAWRSAIAGRSASTRTATSIPRFVEAYSRCGFYVFEGVLKEDELDDIERDVADMLARAPVTRGAKVDRQGRPALGADCTAPNISWVKPLSDPLGGTEPRERPPSGEDVRTGGAGRGAGVRGAADPRVAAVFRCVPARVRPSGSARGRGRDQRRRLHAVQRSGVDQAGAARRFGRVASGRLDALEQRRSSTKAPTASTSWRSCTAATRPTVCGSCPVRIAPARPTSRRWSRRPVRIGCPTRCR